MPDCLACGAQRPVPLLSWPLPESSQRFTRAPGPVRLVDFGLSLCAACGHTQNQAGLARPAVQENEYLFGLSHSGQARASQARLAAWISGKVNLHPGEEVVEVGSGDGFFLRQFAERGFAARGYESSASAAALEPHPALRLERRFFAAGEKGGALTVFRHVLEHLPDPYAFLQGVGSRFLFVEVPRAEFLVRNRMYFDLYNDHLSYFCEASLRRLLWRAGYRVIGSFYDPADEFLGLLAEKGGCEYAVPPAGWAAELAGFAEAFARERAEIRDRLDGFLGPRFDYWGAGSRGITMLHALGLAERVERIVDADPAKAGKFVPGCPRPITPPADYFGQPGERLLISSFTFCDEIWRSVSERKPGIRAATVRPWTELGQCDQE